MCRNIWRRAMNRSKDGVDGGRPSDYHPLLLLMIIAFSLSVPFPFSGRFKLTFAFGPFRDSPRLPLPFITPPFHKFHLGQMMSILAILLPILILNFPKSLAKNELPLNDKGEPIGKSGSQCWTNGNDHEAHWMADGETINRGKFWYKCREGKLKPAGCLDDQGNRLPLNGTFISNGYLLECAIWGGNGVLLRLNTVGCSPDGQKAFKTGEKWQEGEFWWECAWEGDRLKQRMAGCQNGGKRMEIGEKVDDANGEYTMECQQHAGGLLKLVGVECISRDGQHHPVGQQWREGDFLFYCKRRVDQSGSCQKACIGCFFQSQNLFDGDRFRSNGSVFQCEIRPKRHSLKPVACVASNGVERVVDCKWHEQTATGQRVERQCVLRAGRAIVDTLGCVFTKDGINRLFLRPGRFTIWRESMDEGPIGIACRKGKEEGDELTLETFPEEEIGKGRTQGMEMDNDPRQ